MPARNDCRPGNDCSLAATTVVNRPRCTASLHQRPSVQMRLDGDGFQCGTLPWPRWLSRDTRAGDHARSAPARSRARIIAGAWVTSNFEAAARNTGRSGTKARRAPAVPYGSLRQRRSASAERSQRRVRSPGVLRRQTRAARSDHDSGRLHGRRGHPSMTRRRAPEPRSDQRELQGQTSSRQLGSLTDRPVQRTADRHDERSSTRLYPMLRLWGTMGNFFWR